MPRLILATAEGQQAIELRPINSLGRHPNNSIQLLDKIVSKEHCIIELRDGQFILRDLGSLNGTYINNERVRGEQFLKHGDELALGSTRARYDDGSGLHNFAPPAIGPGAIQQPAAPSQGVAPPWVQQPPPRSPYAPNHPTSPASSLQQPSHQPPSGGYGTGDYPGSGPGVGRPPIPPPEYPGRPPSGGGFTGHPSSGMTPAAGYVGNASGYAPPSPHHPHAHPHAPPPAGAPGQRVVATRAFPQGQHRPPSFGGTRVDVLDSARAIGAQIAATTKGFAPFDQIAHDPQQLRLDYERLRITWELSRDIGLERDLDKLLEKILTALFKFVNADRGVILLKEADGSLHPRAARRRDGSDAAIQVSSTILNHVINEQKSVITHDASMDFAASKGKSMILNRISSAIVVPLLHEKEVLGALWLDSESLAQFQQKDLEIITAVGNQAAMFIENTLLAKKIEQEIVTRERFSRLLSPNIAEQVMSGRLEVKKGGQLVSECTVFNSDIRGFTRMSEGTTAEMMVELLNEYFEEMVATIFKYEGTLDKFMGDGIMALWGAPAVHPDDPVRAVQSALDQMEALAQFNRKLMEADQSPLAIGIGIHTGSVVAGYVGSSKALSYTVIGDTANTSARLCGIATAGQILVSESTLSRLGNRFEFEELAPAHLKGKEKALRIFNIRREKPSAAAHVG
ncbi:adenylate/guanylate cyclase domain-containing protein [Pendulispora albinea]|uniref:FHA domain-containing protein n=1 Tax=Pendulispora albinea TaxID=2741071 RepID=A0ABZ2LPN7_9BACT